jgi:hypothetical protein
MTPTSRVETMAHPQGQITSLGSAKSYQEVPNPVISGKSIMGALFRQSVETSNVINGWLFRDSPKTRKQNGPFILSGQERIRPIFL